MTPNSIQFWPLLVQTFGSIGAIIISLAALIILISSIMTPLSVWRLHRKSDRIDDHLTELKATQNRQQQVERLQRDRERKRPPRRRR